MNFIGESVYLESWDKYENQFDLTDFGIPYIEMTKFRKHREDITNSDNMEVLGMFCFHSEIPPDCVRI